MASIPPGCDYPNCPCTYPNCASKEERAEWRKSQQEIAYLDQRTQEYHEWRNRD